MRTNIALNNRSKESAKKAAPLLPSSTFPIAKNTYKIIVDFIKTLDPKGPQGSYHHVLKTMGEVQAVNMFVETLLSRIYNFYQPMDIVQQAMCNLCLKENGKNIEGFLPIKWQVTPEIFEYLQRKLIRIGGWDRELDRHVKKLLFQVNKGIQAMMEKNV